MHPPWREVVAAAARGYTAAAMSPRSAVRTVEVANVADRRRASVRATAFLALATCLFSACRHTTPNAPIPTSRLSPDTNPPGHVATLEARLTALAASPTTVPSTTIPTRAPTYTNTPITRRPAEPAPVFLSREEAAARALAWFLPEQAARVVAVTYVSNVDFWEVVDPLGGKVAMRGAVSGVVTSMDWFFNSVALTKDILALVEVEAGPPKRLAPDFSYEPTWTSLPWYEGPRVGGRRHISYLFNATSGASLGSPYVGDGFHGDDPGGKRRAVFSALQARPIRVVVATAVRSKASTYEESGDATDTPTPDATSPVIPGLPAYLCLPPDSEPVRLPPDVVPAPLAETIRWLPYVQGARWTFERTYSYNDAHWTRGLRLEQVEDRWRLAQDAMLVRLRVAITETVPLDASELLEHNEGKLPRDDWLVLLPSASYPVEECIAGPLSLRERRERIAASTFEMEQPWRHEWEVLLEPKAIGDNSVRARWRADESQTLPSTWSLPPGLNNGCRIYGLGLKATNWESKGFLCPDVGWAAEVNAACGGGGWQICTEHTDMLISYHIPRWRVIP